MQAPLAAPRRTLFRSFASASLAALAALPGSACGGATESAAGGPGAASEEPAWTQEAVERAARAIQGEIESLAGKSFRTPVAVELADKRGFVAYVTERMATLSPPEELERDSDALRLLGLIPPDMDLLATSMEVLEEQVGGFYDPASDTFFLMDTFTGGLADVILAHELTHALDDQYFDLDKDMAERAALTDSSLAYSAVVEGSAMVLMTKWTMRKMQSGELSLEDLAGIDTLGVEAASRAPAVIWKPLLGAYLAGQQFFMQGYALDKKAAKQEDRKSDINALIARAFASPPRSTEQVLHPEKYWSEDQRDEPRRVRHGADDLPPGWSELDRDVFGELSLSLVASDPGELEFPDAASIPMLVFTNPAASGWDGDELLLLGRAEGAARALHLASVWDDAHEAAEFAAALEQQRGRLEAQLAQLAALWGAADGPRGLELHHEPGSDRVVLAAWAGAEAPGLLEIDFEVGD